MRAKLPDPVGLAGGQINLYEYVGSNPMTRTDPDGCDSTWDYLDDAILEYTENPVDYLQDVGKVFVGYGKGLLDIGEGLVGLAIEADPAHQVYKAVHEGEELYRFSQKYGFKQAIKLKTHQDISETGARTRAMWEGIKHDYTDWFTTTDPETFGRSFIKVDIDAVTFGAGTVEVGAAKLEALSLRRLGGPRIPIPKELNMGPRNTATYLGRNPEVPKTEHIYTGTTKQKLRARELQHGGKYWLKETTKERLPKKAARGIEEAAYVHQKDIRKTSPRGFRNVRHPVQPTRPWYDTALEYGRKYLIAEDLVKVVRPAIKSVARKYGWLLGLHPASRAGEKRKDKERR